MIEVPYDLKEVVQDTCLTGSRVICTPPVLDTDLDIVVLVNDYKVRVDIEALGYTLTSKDYGDAGEFYCYRKGDINLIVTDQPQWFEKWRSTTELAKSLNLKTKAYRAFFFSVLVDGVHSEFAYQRFIQDDPTPSDLPVRLLPFPAPS